jgi:hypothetical protein
MVWSGTGPLAQSVGPVNRLENNNKPVRASTQKGLRRSVLTRIEERDGMVMWPGLRWTDVRRVAWDRDECPLGGIGLNRPAGSPLHLQMSLAYCGCGVNTGVDTIVTFFAGVQRRGGSLWQAAPPEPAWRDTT